MTEKAPASHETGAPPQDSAPRRADPKVLQMLVCPLTKTPLHYDEARQELISRAARLAYPIRDGIPVMMAEEARAVEDDELRNLGKR
jgi:uncharacterized protein YbaR (Trm112 family)